MKGSYLKWEYVEAELERWLEWMLLNPELAEKYFPERTENLRERMRQWEPFEVALLIQKTPTHFSKWKAEVNQLSETGKRKMIEDIIFILNSELEVPYDTEIEQQALESVRGELVEQLEYWNEQLNELLLTSKNKEKKIAIGHTEKIDFPTETLIQIMIPACQNRFTELENRLIEKGYFDSFGRWKMKDVDLAAFLYIVKEDKNLIKTSIKKYVPLRKFFNERYKCDISAQCTQPSRMNPLSNRSIGKLLSDLSV